METHSFAIDVPQGDLDDLNARLDAARWPNVVDPDLTEKGLSLTWLREAAHYWRSGFDWRAAEAGINRLPQFTTQIDGIRIHFVHARSAGAGTPVLLVHGWPDSFLRYRGVIPLLVAAGHDVIVPSLPGFAFSGQPGGPLRLAGVAEQLHALVTGLGYECYAVSGGDWGAGIADRLAATHPDAIAALHLTDVPFTRAFEVDRSSASEAEQHYLAKADAWFEQAAYFGIQATEPTALATGLSDSPVALLAWLGSKVRDWSAAEPELDALLTEVSVHWFTGDARSALRLYAESIDTTEWDGGDGNGGDGGNDEWSADAATNEQVESAGWVAPVSQVPTGITLFPEDFVTAPKEYAERFYDLRRFSIAPTGGHFGAAEAPGFFADELVSLLAEVASSHSFAPTGLATDA
ncbi:epoxide hydrolase family protein [Microbacterium sp.]|uniref:epoxide hydrolase family protein n=1 Tax=Microbacterium sp. TaxID=51671 RepID=UPI003C74BDEA